MSIGRRLGWLSLLAAAGWLWAAPAVRIVRISFVQHTVQARPAVVAGQGAAAPWSPALLNAPVIQGEQLRTGSNSAVEVQLECGSALRLAPDSSFSFPRLTRSAKGEPETTVAVGQGVAFFSLRSADARDLQIRLPEGEVLSTSGNARLRVAVTAGAPGTVSVLVAGGSAKVRAAGAVHELKGSTQLRWAAAGAAQSSRARMPKDRWTRWSEARDDAFSRVLMEGRQSGFAGAQLESLPGSTALNPGSSAPQPEWNTGGFPGPPSGYMVNQHGQWEGIGDQPTRPADPGAAGIEVPACALN